MRRSEIADDVDIAVQAQGIIDSLEVLRHDYYFVRRYANEKEQSDTDLQRHIAVTRLEVLEKWQRFWTLGLNHYEADFKEDSENSLRLSRLQELNAKIEAVQRKAFQLSSQVRDIKAKRSPLTEELSSLKSQRDSLSDELAKTQNEHSNLKKELDAKQNDFSEKEEKFRQSRKEAQAVQNRRKEILDSLAEIKLRISRNEAEINASSSSQESLSNEIITLEAQLSEHQKLLDSLSEKKSGLEDAFTRASSEYQNALSKIQSLRRELTHSESQYQSLNNADVYTSGFYPEPVRIILKAAENNLIRSKPMIAADVFTCSSPEAAEAIEAFLGGRQYWLLVRTIEEAQEGIDFLKSNRAGRATYLPLERCRPRERDYRLSFGGGVIGWAMDLVSVNDEWRDAVSHLMGDLLIVRDYGTGAAVVRAGAKFPVATAEGDIFAPSGTISGGAVRQKSGAVTARQRADEIQSRLEALRIKIPELTGEIESEEFNRKNLRLKAEEAESQLEDLRGEINTGQRNIKSAGRDLERLKNERSSSESKLQKLTASLKTDRTKIESLETELEGLPDVQNDNFDAVLSPLRNEIRLLTQRLNDNEALCGRVKGELMKVNSGIERAEREINSGIETEAQNRSELSALGQEKKNHYREALALREEISLRQKESERFRRTTEGLRRKLSRSNENVSAVKNQIAQIEGKLSHLEAECSQMIELWEEKYPYDSIEAKSTEGGRELTSSLRKLERELKSLGSYNLGAISEDQSLAERIDFLTDQLDDVNTSADELRTLIADTDSKVERSFTDSMSRIDTRFNELFTRLFGGGEARLILQEGDSVWDRGVEIFARPPGKKLQNISQLSGGEQSLTSIALIFATLEAAGSSLAVLDEVDAALDEYNLVRFAELAREYSHSIQIIAMTHRRATMERADLIYGVTMVEAGLSATVGINPENYA